MQDGQIFDIRNDEFIVDVVITESVYEFIHKILGRMIGFLCKDVIQQKGTLFWVIFVYL
jgi:hypothetical protein